MDFLIDTHVIIWFAQGSPRLSRTAREVLSDPLNRLCVSGVTAFEFSDLRVRGRIPPIADYATLSRRMALTTLDVPGDLWRCAEALPHLHGDPADRMLVAHAMVSGITLVTADVTIQSYPVATLW